MSDEFDKTLITKLVKSNTAVNLSSPMWDLMMKNIYSLNAFGIDAQDFRMNVTFKDNSEYIGKTSYLVVYNSKKVIKTIEGKFFVGSALIVKGTNAGMEFLSEDEIDTVVNEFASRMATLCSGDIQFSAYEI